MHHAAALLAYTKDEELVQAIRADWRQATISEDERAMLTYCEKLTLTPQQMTQADVELLLDTGFTERNVHDITYIASYFNFVNRMADGLGIELEEEYL